MQLVSSKGRVPADVRQNCPNHQVGGIEQEKMISWQHATEKRTSSLQSPCLQFRGSHKLVMYATDGKDWAV